MTPELIAAEIIPFLTPYLKKGAEEITKSAAGDLWLKVKSIFKERKQDNLTQALENHPEDLDIQKTMTVALEEEIRAKPSLFIELTNILTQMKGISNRIVQNGDQNIGVNGQINNSQINIQK